MKNCGGSNIANSTPEEKHMKTSLIIFDQPNSDRSLAVADQNLSNNAVKRLGASLDTDNAQR